MTTKYEYVCDKCGHEYAEQRNETEPQYFTSCNSCDGSYVETGSTFIEETPEVVIEAVIENLAE